MFFSPLVDLGRLSRPRPGFLAHTLVLALAFAPGCGDDPAATPDTTDASDTDATLEVDTADVADADDSADDTSDTSDTSVADTADTTVPDTSIGDDVYGPHTPPAGDVPTALQSAGWVTHYQDDLEPFWTMNAALGTPVGNYPTFRTMNGLPASNSHRRPRMISRQIFAYVAGFLMTGNPTLLDNAAAGVAWLRSKAIDPATGDCYPELAADGSPIDGVRTAQDQAYCMLGLAAWVFLTRDPAAEADLIRGRDLIMSPDYFWDATNGRVVDALDATLTNEVDVENDGGWELVAQLDQINGYMLLAQPILAEAQDRDQFLADMRTLGDVIVDHFHQDGLVWGVSNKLGQYGSKHNDFGHAMKSVWMLLQIDKRLPDHPFHDFVVASADPLIARSFDVDNGRWSKRPRSATTVEYGSDWWIYAEADQLAATLNLVDGRYDDILAKTQASWLTDYIDRTFAGEIIPGIKRDGTPAYGWPVGDTAKCNEWKNGFHSTEHALVLSILGGQREDAEVALSFAVPPEVATTFIARPYLFDGREVRREPGATVEVGGRTLQIVKVVFRDIY